jgi:hypothetical protein
MICCIFPKRICKYIKINNEVFMQAMTNAAAAAATTQDTVMGCAAHRPTASAAMATADAAAAAIEYNIAHATGESVIFHGRNDSTGSTVSSTGEPEQKHARSESVIHMLHRLSTAVERKEDQNDRLAEENDVLAEGYMNAQRRIERLTAENRALGRTIAQLRHQSKRVFGRPSIVKAYKRTS